MEKLSLNFLRSCQARYQLLNDLYCLQAVFSQTSCVILCWYSATVEEVISVPNTLTLNFPSLPTMLTFKSYFIYFLPSYALLNSKLELYEYMSVSQYRSWEKIKAIQQNRKNSKLSLGIGVKGMRSPTLKLICQQDCSAW